MTFIESLNKGLLAAQNHIRSKEEIEAVFAELSDDVQKISGGKVSICIKPLPKKQWGVDKITVNPVSGFIEAVREDYMVAQLAKWESTHGAFPCFIRLEDDNQEFVVSDTDGLKVILSEIMANPVIGGKILSLMK